MEYSKEWFNDDDFWSQYAPVIFDEKRWAEVPAVVDGVIRLSGLKPGRSGAGAGGGVLPCALDLCCGMGRISAELARRGFAVSGVDITDSFLSAAREDARGEGLSAEYIKEDARSYKRPLFFDIAVNLYISFGYFENSGDDLIVARNVHESLKSGGSFIIETLGKEIAARDYIPGETFTRAGFTVETEYEAVDSWAALKNRWVLSRDKGGAPGEVPFWAEKTFTQRLYSGVEMRGLLLEAGFSAVEIYGGWDGRPYDHAADGLIAVGRKY